MNSYEFKCRDCEAVFEVSCPVEVILSLELNCPACYSENTFRKFTPLATHFNGRGFYSTDNKKKSEKKIE